MTEKMTAGLYLTCETKDRLRKRLIDEDGTVLLDETVSPQEDLLRLMDWDTEEYHQALTCLEENPLFDEGIDLSEQDYRDVLILSGTVSEAYLKDFPEAYYFVSELLAQAVPDTDDGSAMYLLTTGAAVVAAAQEPYRTKNRVRNILEVVFATTEGFTQEERLRKLFIVYPTLGDYPFTLMEHGSYPFRASSLLDLYVYELMAVLRSDKRIARCKNCWRYFVPKTKKKTDYCYRQWPDGQGCQQKGANLKRFDAPAEDRYLAAYKKLRDRFYERDFREYANPEERKAVPYQTYWDWGEIASQAREAYLAGKIDGEELLRRINPEGEPVQTEEKKPEEPPMLSSDWRTMVEHDMDFDPIRAYKGTMLLDLRKPDAEWQIYSPEDQARLAKGMDASLRERYGKKE